MNMHMITQSLLIYRLTGSGTILGGMALASAIPTLIMTLFGGAIADRVQKKYVLLVGLLGLAVITLGIALALTLGYLSPEHPGSWWLLIASAMLQGTITGFMTPSGQAIIPEIVNENYLMNAISLYNLGMNVFRLTAPALAGFLIDAFDFDFVYYTSTGMYLLATIFIILLPPTRAMLPNRSNTLADVLEGIRYIRHETTILFIVVFCLCGVILGMPFQQLLPMFTEDILKVSATELGILMSVSGGGALLGSLVIASLPNKKRGVLLIISSLVLSLSLIGFSFSSWWYSSLVIVAFVGLGHSGHGTLGATLVQYYVDANYRGRMMSFFMMGMGFSSLGTFFAGVLAEAVGIQWSIGGLAVILALMSITVLAFTPRIRNLD
jgi:MFS family permease